MKTLVIVISSNNKNKLREYKEIFEPYKNVIIKSLSDVNIDVDPIENGNTFQENSLIKAKVAWEISHTWTLADDSGLCIEALNGAPGIYSARYAGNHDSDANMNKLLAELKEKTNRNAQFRTVIALILDGETHIFEGIIKGTIAQKKLGSGGFGYDPIFIPEGYQQSFAQLGIDVKNSISHRARAMEKLFKFLHSKFS